MVIGNKGGIKESHFSILFTNSTGNTKFCNSEKVRQEIRTFIMYSKAHEKIYERVKSYIVFALMTLYYKGCDELL